jgi:4-amino-4-deoxy-L-arabinose transferase-like glycosyltransferase
LFAANIVLVGVLVHLAVRSLRVAALAALLFMAAPPMVQIHSMAWSEPVFLTAELSSMIFLAAYLERPRVITLVSASLVAALAFLTRYAGVALVLTGMVGIVALGRDERKNLLKAAATFGILCCLPVAAWLSRNFFAGGTTTNRTVAFHPLGLAHLWGAFNTGSNWFFPTVESAVLRPMLFTVLVSVCIAAVIWRREGAGPRKRSLRA